MSKRYNWRGMCVDLCDSKPFDDLESNPEKLKSARAAINSIIRAGFEGVTVVNTYNKKTGEKEGALLIDVSTIEGSAVAGILGSLQNDTEPCDPNYVFNKILFDYMCLGLPLPNPSSKGKGQKQ